VDPIQLMQFIGKFRLVLQEFVQANRFAVLLHRNIIDKVRSQTT
jgi:hypothetical protein